MCPDTIDVVFPVGNRKELTGTVGKVGNPCCCCCGCCCCSQWSGDVNQRKNMMVQWNLDLTNKDFGQFLGVTKI